MSLENIQGHHWTPFPDALCLHDESDSIVFTMPSIRCIGVHQGFCGTKFFCCIWISICRDVNPSPKKNTYLPRS